MVDSGRATTCLWERDERDVGERLPVDASEPYIRAALPGVCLVPRRHRLNLASYHPRPPQLLLHPGVVALPPSLLVVSPPSRTPLLVVGDRLRAVDVGVHRARNVLGRRPTVAVRDDHTLARPEGSRRVGKLFTRTPLRYGRRLGPRPSWSFQFHVSCSSECTTCTSSAVRTQPAPSGLPCTGTTGRGRPQRPGMFSGYDADGSLLGAQIQVRQMISSHSLFVASPFAACIINPPMARAGRHTLQNMLPRPRTGQISVQRARC